MVHPSMMVLSRIEIIRIHLGLFLLGYLQATRIDGIRIPDWKKGDWAMESLMATDEPIGVAGEWSDYVYTLAETYDEEPYENKEYKFVTGPYNERDWRPVGPSDIPYVAVLVRKDHGASDRYKKQFPNEPDPETSHVEPGTACGGAFLTPQLVLTSCGCLVSLISKLQQIPDPFFSATTFHGSFNIYDLELGRVPDIYVTKLSGRFINLEYKYVVETDKRKWPSRFEKLNCRERLMSLETLKKNATYETKAVLLNTELVVVPFTPAISPNGPIFFPKWPPHPINEVTDRFYKDRVELISVGMVLTTPPPFEFYSSVSATATELLHRKGNVRTQACDSSRIKIGVNVACFGAVKSQYYLTGGTIGWPVVAKGELVGLTASARSPVDGTVLVAVLHKELSERIENLIGKKVLEKQNTPAPVYRSHQLSEKYQIYDYSEPDAKPDPKSLSCGTTLRTTKDYYCPLSTLRYIFLLTIADIV